MQTSDKLATAIRGYIHEHGPSNQNHRHPDHHLSEAKENLTKLIADQMDVERTVKRLIKNIGEYEKYAAIAFEKGEEDLAKEIMDKIAQYTIELKECRSTLADYNLQIDTLKQIIFLVERDLRAMEHEMSVMRTTDNLNNVRASLTTLDHGSAASVESLQHLVKQMDIVKARMEVENDGPNEELKSKIQAAGIILAQPTAIGILSQIKQKHNTKP